MTTLGRPLGTSKYQIENYLGVRFGSRVVVDRSDSINGNFAVEARCDCGDTRGVALTYLLAGRHLRCGKCAREAQLGPKGHGWKGGRIIPASVYGHWLRSAVRRGLDWAVDIDYLEILLESQEFRCALTGTPLTIGNGPTKKGTGILSGNMSLGRINSSLGYTKSNVQFVTKSVNMAKQDMDETEFVTLCSLVARHRS